MRAIRTTASEMVAAILYLEPSPVSVFTGLCFLVSAVCDIADLQAAWYYFFSSFQRLSDKRKRLFLLRLHA